MHVLITGASGGLGRALAETWAAPGVTMSLWGRNAERLAATETACRDKGAEPRGTLQDVREFDAVRELLTREHGVLPVDLAFINAGVSTGMTPDGRLEDSRDACRTLEVNAVAAINVLTRLHELMAVRGSGHLVIISSVAAFFPLPSSPAYSAAKRALADYGRALRLEKGPVRVSVVYPGYIDTPMSRRLIGPQPFRVSATEAAGRIRRDLEAGCDNVSFPWPLVFGLRLLNVLPESLAGWFARRGGFTVRPDGESPLSRP